MPRPDADRRRSSSAGGGRGNARLRRLDETLGIVAIAALGALTRRRRPPARPRRIGIMKTTGIGDVVLLSAVVRDVAAAFPDAEVVLVCGGENAGLARTLDAVRIVEIPPAVPHRAIAILRRERLDWLLDFGQWSRLEALYARLSGARWTAGFATPGQRRHAAYDVAVPHGADVPELENFRRVAAAAGVHSTSLPRLQAAGETEPSAPDPFVVFHLWPGGYRSELREWPLDRWRELAARMDGDGYAVVLTGGREDAERTAAFARSCDGVLQRPPTSLAGRCSLAALVGVLASARCVVSVNTGVMHMAAATGVPTVALNGPTDARRWGPVGPAAVNVDSSLPGCGFLNLGFEYAGEREDCMQGISVEDVAAAARELARA
jgi:ADP-heptose:LPS heptosyltransferase